MYKITNIETLGTDYTVANRDGKVIRNVQIISHTEIIEAALGVYDETQCDMSTYIERGIAALSGNEDIDPHSIYWHSTEDEEVVLDDIIEYAIKNGYSTIILEQLEPVLH